MSNGRGVPLGPLTRRSPGDTDTAQGCAADHNETAPGHQDIDGVAQGLWMRRRACAAVSWTL